MAFWLAKLGQIIAVVVTNRSGLVIMNKYYGPLAEPGEALGWQQNLFDTTKDDWPELVNETQRVALDSAGRVIAYTGVGDVLVFVAGTEEYDELILCETLNSIVGILKHVSAKDKKGIVSQTELVAHYDQLCLMLGVLIHKVRRWSSVSIIHCDTQGTLEQMDSTQIEPQSRVAYEEIWRRNAKKEEKSVPLSEDLIIQRYRPEVPATARGKKKGK